MTCHVGQSSCTDTHDGLATEPEELRGIMAEVLFQELTPGPLAPEARIIPLDQKASCVIWICVVDLFLLIARTSENSDPQRPHACITREVPGSSSYGDAVLPRALKQNSRAKTKECFKQ